MKTSAHYEERYKRPFTCEICHNTLTLCQFLQKKNRARDVKSSQFSNNLLHCWQGNCTSPVQILYQVISALNSLGHMVQANVLSPL